MTHPALIERITRSLAYMLRHQPDQFDLELDRFGYADVVEVVQALNERLDEPIEEEDIEDAVQAGASTRYEITDGKIRALYGHSIDVEPGESAKPPEFLYVGLPVRDAERALKTGLRGGRRRFLHLALTEESAGETGRRLAKEYTLVEVHALDAWEEGINFYDRKSLFLSDTIPTAYLELGETCDDGEGPPIRRTGRGDERGPRGGSGGRGRRPARDDDCEERPRQSADSGRGRDDAPREEQPRQSADSGRGRGRGRDDAPREEQPRQSADSGRGRGRGRDDAPREERPREPRRDEERRPRRDERPAREPEPREQEVAKRDVPRPAKKQTSSADSFGTGVHEARAKEERKPSRPAPRKEAPKTPEPVAPKKPAQPDGPGFGAGV